MILTDRSYDLVPKIELRNAECRSHPIPPIRCHGAGFLESLRRLRKVSKES